jgi:hypothetical protein
MAVYEMGAHGPEVLKIQTKLRELNFYRGLLDGNFGGGTESAVKSFQRLKGLAVDGVVGPATLDKLFAGDVPVGEPSIKSEQLLTRCLALTGSFETDSGPPDCFAGLSGDFDGQGISFGVCQWNFGQGSLQPLLREMVASHPEVVDNILHDHAEEFRRMLAASAEEQMEWARSIQDSHHRIIEPWRGLLKTFGRSDEFIGIQAAEADKLFERGLTLCREFSLKTERAAALLFDIIVQNGGINEVVKAQIQHDFRLLSDGNEVSRPQIVANRRADAAKAQWRQDVRIRKLTIANGTGTVHGRRYDLDVQYGIGLRAVAV